MTRPRVLYVSPVADMKGGAESVLMTMLANPLVEPVLATPAPGQVSAAAEMMGVPVRFFHPRAMMAVHRPLRLRPMLSAALDLVRCAVRLRRIARAHGCVIIHSNGLKSHVLNTLLGGLFRLRTVVHLHDIPHGRMEMLIWRLLGSFAGQVIVVSRACWPGATQVAKVHVVPNGFTPLVAEPAPRRLGRVLRLGYVGRFTPFKGLDLLLDWAQALRAAGIEFVLHVRGRADPETEAYWAGILARIGRDGLADVVRLDGWRDKTTVYDGIDILLLPSRIPDPLPLAATEAMGAGLVVATYPAGGLAEHITDGETGFLIPEPSALAARLRRLLDEPGLYEGIQQRAHKLALSRFNLGGFYQSIADIYAGMLAQ